MKNRALQIGISIILGLLLLSSCAGSKGTQNWRDRSSYGNSPYCAVSSYRSTCIYHSDEDCAEATHYTGEICMRNSYR